MKFTTETLDAITDEFFDFYEALNLTRDDIKQAWKQAIEILLYDGTLVSGDLPGNDQVDVIKILLAGLNNVALGTPDFK